MKANVYRLLPNRERIKRQEAAEISAMIADTSLPRHLKERVRHELYRAVEPDSTRSPFGVYVMLSVQQIGAIWDALRALPAKDRPQEVRHAFDICVLNLRQDTGEVMLTRDEIAERMKITPYNVSRAMGVMERLGIIIKGDRRRVEGLRGRGIVPYFVNPHAAWNGHLELQKIEARRQTPPLLALMEGGKAD
jgi:CRP-like cAMP-binding protein